ncbi:hypothetical protein [Siminovitchia fortis]|nr:hypothetical protein [Siminovitchia fortis]
MTFIKVQSEPKCVNRQSAFFIEQRTEPVRFIQTDRRFHVIFLKA